MWCGSTAHVVWDSSVLKHRMVWRHIELLSPHHRGAPSVAERRRVRVRRRRTVLRGHLQLPTAWCKFGEEVQRTLKARTLKARASRPARSFPNAYAHSKSLNCAKCGFACDSTRGKSQERTPVASRARAGSPMGVTQSSPARQAAPRAIRAASVPEDVLWATDPSAPFSTPFELSASEGRIWIAPANASDGQKQVFYFKGANWVRARQIAKPANAPKPTVRTIVQAGFQASGCVHRLWDDTVEEYIAFLVEHRFNSVRLPLSVQWILTNDETNGLCGEYEGWATLDILDDLVIRLEQAGIFVVLDMHTLEVDGNQGLWCYPNSRGECTANEEAPIREAWEVLAARYCSSPNVVGADLFNEPYSATWGLGSSGTDWGLAAGRLGNHVLSHCSRWLILVEGVANNDGQCRASASHDFCWCQP